MKFTEQEILRILSDCEQFRSEILYMCKGKLSPHYDLAEDCVQEAYIALIVHLKRNNTSMIQDYKSWLFKVAYNHVNKRYKIMEKERRYSVSMDSDWYEAAAAGQTFDFMDKDATDTLVEALQTEILSCLSNKERSLYTDIYIKKVKYSEISMHNGVKINTVKQQKLRLEKKIKVIIKKKLETL